MLASRAATQTALNTAPATEPTAATAAIRGDKLRLSNSAIEADWQFREDGLVASTLTDRVTNRTISLAANAFVVSLSDGTVLKSSEMRVIGQPRMEKLEPDPNSSQLAARFGGWQIEVGLRDPDNRLQVMWRAVLRDGSAYVRQEVTLSAIDKDLPIGSVRLVDVTIPGVRVYGSVKGSPIVAGNLFFGFEHPLSESKASGDRGIAQIWRGLPLRTGQAVTYSSVAGVTLPGQLRRGFLAYLERERAHPYRTFLHYNSWYDIGYETKYDEADALGAIHAFGDELVERRGVKMDSFMFDDGWDDEKRLWHFHSGFPNGFTPVKEAALKVGAAPGIWFSPWGGYGAAKAERLKYGKEQGFETNEGGFALSAPKYYALFRETTLDFIRKFGINQFKIDGTGNVDTAFPGSAFDSDFQAAISLIREWRAVKPDIYINLTTGTYPSPFWLQYADSIWRGGDDHSFLGVGSWRQRWITYRDADTYSGIVMSGPLFPLNSLMLHGLIYARHANHLDKDPNGDFTDEVHDYFGTGTQLQEMYITHSLLTEKDWDVLAEAAKWSRENADTLVDTHWIGGDPALLEVYGWASWSPRKGILVLRNPNDKPQDFVVDVNSAFELPPGAARTYEARSPWRQDREKPSLTLSASAPYAFHLQPFQVLTLEASPKD
ncbi:MAG: enterotoxin [Candidatus Sulfotelmatobacter sp.]